MDERVERCKTPEDCEQFALNVEARLPELARDARRRAVELKAQAYGDVTQVERDALAAIYAYERVLSLKRGKKVRASRTWQMIDRHGIIETIERAVNRDSDATGYVALAEMNMQDLAFEAIVVKHPNTFTKDAVERSAERLHRWEGEARLQNQSS